MQPQGEPGTQQCAEAQQPDRGQSQCPQPGFLGAGQQQPGQLDQQHERRELDQGDDRLQHTRHDQRGFQRGQQASRALRPPGSAGRRSGGRCGNRFGGFDFGFGGGFGGRFGAIGAHRPALGPVSLGVQLGLGKAELILQPRTQMLQRAGFRRHPAVPVRPVPGFDRGGQRCRVATLDPVHPQPRVLGDGDQQVVLVVLLEIDLDRNVLWQRADDPVHRRYGRRVTDQQVAGGQVVGHGESRRTQGHHGDGVARLGGPGPLGRRPRRFVQHHVDREMPSLGFHLGHGVAPLELGLRAVWVGNPEPQIGRRFGDGVVEHRR